MKILINFTQDVGKVNIEEWENIRGPRIWEEETLKILPTYKKKIDEAN